MKWTRVIAVARKEVLHVVRDARSLAMAIALPMLLLVLYGYALTMDLNEVPTVVWDQSQTPTSRELVSSFFGSDYFLLQGQVGSYEEVEHAIDTGEALTAIVIPPDFGRRIAARQATPLQLLVDGSNPNTATIAIGYAEAVVNEFSGKITLEHIRKISGVRVEKPLELRPRAWFNEDLKSRNYVVPGLIAVMMMMIAAMLTSLTVAREWEQGTMEQLISTPIRGPELVLGKLLPYMGIGLIDTGIAVAMGAIVFQVPMRGSGALLFAMAVVFLTGALSLGLLVSIVTKNQLMANQLASTVTLLPSIILSGFVFEIRSMPTVVQWISHIVPAKYFITLLRGIYLKGIGLEILALQAALLLLFAAAMVTLAMVKFRKKLA